jgi:hypothetical protein
MLITDFHGRHVACRQTTNTTSYVVLWDVSRPNTKNQWRVSFQERYVTGDCNGAFVEYLDNAGAQLVFTDSTVNGTAVGSGLKTFQVDFTRDWATAFTQSTKAGLDNTCATGCCVAPKLAKPVDIIACNSCAPGTRYYSKFGSIQFNANGSFYTSSMVCTGIGNSAIDTTLKFTRT